MKSKSMQSIIDVQLYSSKTRKNNHLSDEKINDLIFIEESFPTTR